MWRNWYTRTLEVRVALPCEFESRHPHIKEGTRSGAFFLLKPEPRLLKESLAAQNFEPTGFEIFRQVYEQPDTYS
jgi:hypothetical protein